MNDKGTAILDEYSKLVNELVNARREMARLNEILSGKERFLSRILDISPSIVYILDLSTLRLAFSSRGMASLLGGGEAEKSDTLVLDFIHKDDKASVLEHYAAMVSAPDSEIRTADFRVLRENKSWRWLRAKDIVFTRGESGKPIQIVGVLDDVTDQKEREDALRRASAIDPLTGLLNRRGFMDSAGLQLRSLGIRALPCTLAFFDVDNLKDINDRHGHGEGDIALKAVADALRMSFRSSDILARFGGDEFVAFAGNVTAATAEPLLGRIRRNVASISNALGKPWKLECSIGCSFFSPLDASDLDRLIAVADGEMYKNKAKKKNTAADWPVGMTKESASCENDLSIS